MRLYRKNCDKCNKPSFSSSEYGEWLCPVCGHDLTAQPFFDAVTFEQVYIKTLSGSTSLSFKGKEENENGITR